MGFHLAFVEALLRVFLPQRSGSIHAEIISVAEEIGFIHHIDNFALDRLIQMLNRHPAISGSINISQRTIADDAASIVRRLGESGLAPRIIVEITETASVPLELVQRRLLQSNCTDWAATSQLMISNRSADERWFGQSNLSSSKSSSMRFRRCFARVLTARCLSPAR